MSVQATVDLGNSPLGKCLREVVRRGKLHRENARRRTVQIPKTDRIV